MCMDHAKTITNESANLKSRVLLAVEKYKKGEVSLGRAAEVAGMPVGRMMTVLQEFGVRSLVELEDHRQGLAHLAKVW
jgi:predicted HTH domain antitoxin